jgi:two-component system, chemotaxis family, sensor kinase CheA
MNDTMSGDAVAAGAGTSTAPAAADGTGAEIAAGAAEVAVDVTREERLNQAAVRLLTGSADEAALHEIRALLLPISADDGEAQWVRDAIATAVDLLDQAVAGALSVDSAAARIGSLLELVMMGDQNPSASADYALPADTARELFPDFVAESVEYLEQAERALLELESNPHHADAVNVVFRAFHTIKSTAAFLGLEPISTLAHGAESLLCHVRDGRVPCDGACADIILACADMMRELVSRAHTALDHGVFSLPAEYPALLDSVIEAERLIASGGSLAEDGASAGGASASGGSAGDASAGGTTGGGGAARTSSQPTSSENDSWVRVRTRRLDELVDLVGELVVAQSMIAQDPLIEHDRHGPLGRKVSHTSKIVRELQDLSMSLRMVPLRPLFHKMQRLVRDLSKKSGKQVQLVTDGEDTEIDRNMVDVLTDPLVHMIRNAIDHGIEPAEQRTAAGKSPTGTLRLAAYHAGGAVVVELHDDGRGLDHDRILASAVAKGVIDRDRGLAPSEVYNLIFAPGLSTADGVTSLSGRGVGMDVVRRNIDALRGRIEIASTPSRGTSFTLRLPLTLAITEGMLVRVGTERYIIPTVNIYMSFRPAADALTTAAGGGELVMLHGSVIPIVRLHHLFEVSDAATDPTRGLLVVVGDVDRRYALLVDELLGQQQFVAKSVGTGLGEVPGVAGGAILGDGHVGLILDPAAVVAAARRLAPHVTS